MKARLKDRHQHQIHRHLHHAIPHRRDSQRALSSILLLESTPVSPAQAGNASPSIPRGAPPATSLSASTLGNAGQRLAIDSRCSVVRLHRGAMPLAEHPCAAPLHTDSRTDTQVLPLLCDIARFEAPELYRALVALSSRHPVLCFSSLLGQVPSLRSSWVMLSPQEIGQHATTEDSDFSLHPVSLAVARLCRRLSSFLCRLMKGDLPAYPECHFPTCRPR